MTSSLGGHAPRPARWRRPGAAGLILEYRDGFQPRLPCGVPGAVSYVTALISRLMRSRGMRTGRRPPGGSTNGGMDVTARRCPRGWAPEAPHPPHLDGEGRAHHAVHGRLDDRAPRV